MMEKKKITYQQAGVNIDAGNNLVECIAPLLRATQRPGTNTSIGGFASAIDLKELSYKDPIILTTTDGVGTKLKLAQQCNKYDTIGVDLVAMCVNDLLVHGSQPISFLDYYATGKLNIEHAQAIISGIVEGCKQSNCALTGGETAEMPGVYNKDDFDLAGFALGIAERNQLLPKLEDIKPGDTILGIASSGIHSNGYSLVRYLIQEHCIDLFAKPPFAADENYLYEVLLKPTKIYVKSIMPAIKHNLIKALAHITGGGLLENIPRVLPKNVGAYLNTRKWPIPPLFQWLQKLGNIDATEMVRTFNCGIGMIIIVDTNNVKEIKSLMSNEEIYEIGFIIESNDTLIIDNLNIFKK